MSGGDQIPVMMVCKGGRGDFHSREIVSQSSTSESSMTWFFSFDVERSMFDVRRSMFDVERSMFDVRRSMFDVERSMFDVRRSSLKTTQWHKCNP
jgi:hypothetical protein